MVYRSPFGSVRSAVHPTGHRGQLSGRVSQGRFTAFIVCASSSFFTCLPTATVLNVTAEKKNTMKMPKLVEAIKRNGTFVACGSTINSNSADAVIVVDRAAATPARFSLPFLGK